MAIGGMAALALLVAACGSGDGAGSNGADAGEAVGQTPANLQDDPNNTAVPLSSPAPVPSPVAALPPGFRGRWGLVDEDCITGRDDAKGLMIVAAHGLRFYESRAAIRKATAIRPGTLQLDLAFTGEGQQWNRTETLTLLDDAQTLVRQEQKPAGTLRYSRCPADREGPAVPTGA